MFHVGTKMSDGLHNPNGLSGLYVQFNNDGQEDTDHPQVHIGRKVPSPAEENLERLHSLFRPLQLLMGCLGLWHPSLYDVQRAPERHRWAKSTRWLLAALSMANVVYTFCNFALLLLSRPTGKITTWTWNVFIVLTLWPLQACLMALFHLFVFEWEFVSDLWEVWAKAMTVRIGAEQWTKLAKLRNVYIALAVLATLLSSSFVLIGMMASPNVGNFLHTFLRFPLNPSLMVINLTALTFIMTATAAFTTVFFVLHCHIIAGSLISVYANMEKRVHNNTVFTEVVLVHDKDMSVLEYFRQQRGWSKRLVEAMDRAFRHVSFLNYVSNVPLIVFIMYALITHIRNNPLMVGACCITILASFFQLFAVSIAAAWIHKWGTRPKELLHDMQIPKGQYPNLSDSASLALLLHEVSEDYVGVTAWKLVLITKKFIVTALGLIISYIIILYEFGHLNEVVDHLHELGENTQRIERQLAQTVLHQTLKVTLRPTSDEYET